MKLPDVQLNLPNFNLHKLLAFINSEKTQKTLLLTIHPAQTLLR